MRADNRTTCGLPPLFPFLALLRPTDLHLHANGSMAMAADKPGAPPAFFWPYIQIIYRSGL